MRMNSIQSIYSFEYREKNWRNNGPISKKTGKNKLK